MEEAPNPPRSVEFHTLRHGDVWWIKECCPTIDAWAAKHGHNLRVWGLRDISKGYPCPKFVVLDMLRAFVDGPSEWMMFLDADIWIHPDMPAFPPIFEPGFYVRTDIAEVGKCAASFPKWSRITMHWGKDPALYAWSYRNTGVWVCDKQTARELLSIIRPPYYKKVQEQHQLNWWLFLYAKNGGNVGQLPVEWNCMPGEESKANPPAFHHMCGVKKDLIFKSLLNNGFVKLQKDMSTPIVIPPSIPGTFIPEFYLTHGAGEFAMDLLHTQLLHGATHLPTTRPNNERVALEVGSWKGHSTAALIEAIDLELYSHLHIVEIVPTPELHALISKCKYPERVTLHTRPMWELDLGQIDFAFIDGCHKGGAFADLFISIACGAEIVCMHDSMEEPNHHFWGAVYGAKFLRRMPNWHYIDDGKRRSGARTERGFTVAAKREIDLTIVQDLIDQIP